MFCERIFTRFPLSMIGPERQRLSDSRKERMKDFDKKKKKNLIKSKTTTKANAAVTCSTSWLEIKPFFFHKLVSIGMERKDERERFNTKQTRSCENFRSSNKGWRMGPTMSIKSSSSSRFQVESFIRSTHVRTIRSKTKMLSPDCGKDGVLLNTKRKRKERERGKK